MRRNVVMAVCMVLAISAGCEGEGDPTAPEGSSISVSANPQTVILPADDDPNAQAPTTEITATVRSANGTRLPDQEITFSTTAGDLDPPPETPLKSDDQGQAKSILTTITSTTVTASSGSVSNTTQIQAVAGNLATFIININPDFIDDCNDMVMATATVLDTRGLAIAGVTVIFDEGPTSEITGSFSPARQVVTDANGLATATWTPNGAQCAAECMAATMDPNSGADGSCLITLIADDSTGSFTSVPAIVQDNIP